MCFVREILFFVIYSVTTVSNINIVQLSTMLYIPGIRNVLVERRCLLKIVGVRIYDQIK